MRAWNDWYHCVICTYGAWLPGDPRGFRTRHHRKHIEGDYKHPPLAPYATLHKRSRMLLKRPPVRLAPGLRGLVRDQFLASLQRREVQVVALCVDDHHLHVLARFRAHNPRRLLGIAKKESAHHGRQGPLWAGGGKVVPVTDRDHQVYVARYILDHAARGAAVWRCRPLTPAPAGGGASR